MTFTWREHGAALEEYQACAAWYEERRAGWGTMFMDAVDAAIESVLDPSVRWGFYRDRRTTPQIYSRSVGGFPVDIVFLLLDDVVYVVAYAHERRRPEYWRERLKP